MPTTYTDLIADIRKRTKQVCLEELKRRLEAREKMTLVDVREKDEWRAGYIPGAVFASARVPRDPGRAKLPDKNARIVAYCAGGTRSALAAATLQDLGLHERRDRESRLRAVEGPRLPAETPPQLTDAQRER